ncbi:MAG: hypothetical protein NTZ59_11830, partial [Bacteroidetes bacterium]|nr:hypothetical protein [Bacteroidota bacterium]
ELKNKVILIISPQAWGKMFLAKHHYAIELAKHNNEVYFLNPPQEEKVTNTVQIKKNNIVSNLYLIHHSLPFTYKIKFKFKKIFHFLMHYHIKKIEQTINKKIDIIWSFDLGDYYPFKYFSNNPIKFFNPIDEPLNKDGINSAKNCDVIVSITKEILAMYHQSNVPKHFIHHALAEEFIELDTPIKNDNIIRFGLSGNWLRKDIDTDCLLEIVKENEEVIFEFWGSYKTIQSNIGGESDTEVKRFIAELMVSKNVVLHGPIHPSELAQEFRRMDGFLICYDILKDQSHGTNYHKVMEYLSTGKVVVSNNITTYASIPNLLEMSDSRTNNNNLPTIFKNVVSNLKHYNHPAFQALRSNFAKSNLYSKKIGEIEKILKKLKK